MLFVYVSLLFLKATFYSSKKSTIIHQNTTKYTNTYDSSELNVVQRWSNGWVTVTTKTAVNAVKEKRIY